MASSVRVELRLSAHAQEFMAAALDLLASVEHADPVLLTDDVAEAAERLRNVLDIGQGEF